MGLSEKARERLGTLVRLVSGDATDESFDMHHWRYTPDGKVDWECGTTGCMLGHATRLPEFGFVNIATRNTPAVTRSTGGHWTGVKAGQKVSDLTDEQAIWLFGSGKYFHGPDQRVGGGLWCRLGLLQGASAGRVPGCGIASVYS